MAVCRVCGAQCGPDDILSVDRGGGCRSCNGSPACVRCGHARRQHHGTFGGAGSGCDAVVAADVGLAIGRCGCAGYTTDRESFGDPVEIVDVVELRLRGPGESRHVDLVRLAPARDLFDEGRRLRDLSGPGPLPWRPPE